MKDSVTYQAILEEGREEEARRLLLRLGESRFGAPDPAVKQALESLSLERLEALSDRLLRAESWEELLVG